MRIHNFLEEVVLDKIEEILAECQKEYSPEKLALANEYKLDIACYVLNRLSPIYLVSGRGLAYLDLDYLDKLQRDADLVALIHQGIERITAIKRPHYHHVKNKKDLTDLKNYYFNFPVIKGRIFSSVNFEPLYNIEVELLHNHQTVEMIDVDWQNPYHIVANTPGNFYFWPKPVPAPHAEAILASEFELKASVKGFEELRHFFIIEVKAEEGYKDFFRLNNIYCLKDLYLLPREDN